MSLVRDQEGSQQFLVCLVGKNAEALVGSSSKPAYRFRSSGFEVELAGKGSVVCYSWDTRSLSFFFPFLFLSSR